MAQRVKNLSAMQETWVRSLGGEDPLEKEITPVFLPGESRGQRSPVGCSPWGCKESDTTERLTLLLSLGHLHGTSSAPLFPSTNTFRAPACTRHHDGADVMSGKAAKVPEKMSFHWGPDVKSIHL